MASIPRKVLIADDSAEDRELWRSYLSGDPAYHYTFFECDGVNAALEICFAEHPDVVLLDFYLRQGNGVEFLEALQASGQTRTFPTVMLTGTGNELVAVRALKAGAQDYLLKDGIEAATLRRAIDTAIYKAKTEELLARQRTELEAAYRQAEEARRQAEEANARKDQFLAVLSHELRTPLMPILLVVSSPKVADSSPERLRDIFHLIRRNVELEARLIDDLLDVTRIANGKLELHREPTNLHEVITHALEMCQPAAQAKGIELVVLLEAASAKVHGDPTRLRQVVWNLVHNGVKFTPAGGSVRIETRSDEEWIELAVSDTGIGIAPERIEAIFDAFEQGSLQVAREFGGLGLGLTICKAVVTLHGGRIAAQSDGAGRGATFRVALKLIAGENPGDRALAQALPADGANPPGAARRLLLVEDHDDSARVLRNTLRKRGYDVVLAQTVAEAKSLFAEGHFDGILTDFGLPDGNGADLLVELSATRRVPAIVLSGLGEADVIARSLKAGARAHLLKPVSWPQLESAIEEMLK